MLVDPNTGLPIEEEYREPTALKMLGALPGAPTTASWNALRGSNTIIGGGWGKAGRSYGAVSTHMRPRSFFRFGNVSTIDSSALPKERYSPFNILGSRGFLSANNAVNRATSSFTKKVARRATYSVMGGKDIGREAAGMGKVGNWFYNNLGLGSAVDNQGIEYFSKGTLSRWSAAGRMRKVPTAEKFTNIVNAAKTLDPAMEKVMGNMAMGDMVKPWNLRAATAGSVGGRASQYMGGYMFGASSEFAGAAEAAGGKAAFLSGARMSAKHLALGGVERFGESGALRFAVSPMAEKFGMSAVKAGFSHALANEGGMAAAKFAGAAGAEYLGMAIPGLNVLMTAKLVYDLSKMATIGVVGLMDAAKTGVTSLKGSIDKPIMGMGFKDNSVAATSRARGVAAIQNSRLNARSVLGSEAAGLAAHFG